MLVRIHVYDDGDVELKKVQHKNNWDNAVYFEYPEQTEELKAELKDYGHEEDRINVALNELKEIGMFEEVIV